MTSRKTLLYQSLHRLRPRSLLILAGITLTWFFCLTSFGQVKIREKVEIHPKETHGMELSFLPDPPGIAVDTRVTAYAAGLAFYLSVNGISFGSPTPVSRFSELLNNRPCEVGIFPPGSPLNVTIGTFTKYTQGYPDIDLIQEPRTAAWITLDHASASTDNGMICSWSFSSDDYWDGARARTEGLLDRFLGTIEKDSLEPGEETTLHLTPVSTLGGTCGVHDNVHVGIVTDGYIRCLDADYQDDSRRFYVYLWSKAKQGIRIVADPAYWSDAYRENSITITCDKAWQNYSVPIWTQMYIAQFGVSVAPSYLLNYADTAQINIYAQNGYCDEVIPERQHDLIVQISSASGGPIVPCAKLGSRPVAQSNSSSVFPNGYFLDEEGMPTDVLYISYTKARNTGFKYIALGDSLKDALMKNVTLSVTDERSPSSGYGQIYVTAASIVVTAVPPTLSPGDTADIIVKKKQADGTIVDFRPEQRFEIGLIDGCTSGEILTSWGEKSTYFDGVMHPIKFIAADSIDPANSTVVIQAGIMYEAGGSRDISASVKSRLSKKMKPGLRAPNDECGVFMYHSNVFGVGDLSIESDSVDHFEVKLAADTVAFTERTKITVQAKNAKNEDVKLADNALLTFSIETNPEYGTFIAKNGDTVKTTPALLKDISYIDAKSGLIEFAAVKKNPDSSVTCKIQVELQEKPKVKGDTSAIVVEQTLKIVMDPPYAVLPTKLLGQANQAVANENKKPFSVRMTRNRKPIPAYSFILTTNYINGSGGHDHRDLIRPANSQLDKRSNYGYFIRVRDSTNHDRPYIEVTGSDGYERFCYAASMFGDSMKIIVESADSTKNRFLRDSIGIIEIVSDLVLLDEGTNYRMVGGLCAHHGPREDSLFRNCRTPNHNHYARSDVNESIQRISSVYHTQFPRATLIMVNDMSLPYGGRFDIDGNWAGYSRHHYHRQGTDVDIQRSGAIPRRNEAEFSRICTDNGVQMVFPEDEAHFHLFFVLYPTL